MLRGHVDRLDQAVHGWVVDPAQPEAALALELLVDGVAVVQGTASLPRPDVAAAGLGGPACGFVLLLPPHCLDGAEHALALRTLGGPPFRLPGLPARLALGRVRFTLEPARPALLDEVLALLRLSDEESALDPALVRPATVAHWLGAGHPLTFARANGRLVGYASVQRHDLAAGPAGLLRMSVITAYRRRGIGQALLEDALARSRAHGHRAMWLTVGEGNLPARRLYAKLGFHPAPAAPVPGWQAFGEVPMQKRL